MNLKNKILVLSLGLLAMVLTSCRWGESSVQPIKGSEVLVLVNVLDTKFFNDCNIEGSINISMDDLESYALKNWDKVNTHIVVYCANYKCTASGESAKMLKKLDFKNVQAYEGGIAEWKNLGYPTKGSPCTQGYLKDYKKPDGHVVDPDLPVIEANELKAKIAHFALK